MQTIRDPALFGFAPERLNRIDTWMQRYIDDGKFAGSSVLVARHGEIVHLATCGQRSIERGQSFDIDTIVRIYSMTKPITSVVAMMLVEKGEFNLDAPVDRFLPEFRNCSALIDGATDIDQYEPAPSPTIHQLLTHTSGMTYDFNEGVLANAYAAQAMNFSSRTGAVQGNLADKTVALAAMPLAFQPGSRWEYSVGIDVIGRVIEVVTGKSLAQVFQEEVFDPLGMVDTGFAVPTQLINRFASCYSYTPANTLQLTDDAETSEFLAGQITTWSGGGGLVSTLADYFRFTEMLRCGGALDGVRLLSPRTLDFMRRNHLKGDIASMGPKSFAEMPMEGMGFGLGGSVVLDPARQRTPGSVGDFSWGGMASTLFWCDPVEQITTIFFTQLIPSNIYPNRAELKALVHAALID